MSFDRKEYMKNYRLNKKEEIKIQRKGYYQKNKDVITRTQKDYMKDRFSTDEGYKSITISRWKSRGIINDNYDVLYDEYINTTNCDYCNVELNDGDDNNRKCLDHEHQSGEVRGILCMRCNVKDVFSQN